MTDTFGFDVRIAPELEPLTHDIDSVKPHPENIRVHKLDAIKHSLARFGQQTPLTVQRSTMFICKGNGTWSAAKALGWNRIAYHVEDFDDMTALQYLMADNKASDLSSYDAKMLAQGLNKLVEGPGLTDSLWTVDELEDLEYNLVGAKVTESPFAPTAAFPDRPAPGETPVLPGSHRMRQVSILVSVEDHAEFVANLRKLQPAYGTAGSIDTILEAVRRETALLTGAPDPRDIAAQVALRLDEVAAEFGDRPTSHFTGKQVADRILLNRLSVAEPAEAPVAGQEEMFGGEE